VSTESTAVPVDFVYLEDLVQRYADFMFEHQVSELVTVNQNDPRLN
jgi:hypothetical protein